MNRNLVFFLPNDSEDMIHTFNLKMILSNSRTSIYQNEYARFSIDNKVVRVLIYNKDNNVQLEKIRNYFYGDEYEKL